MNFGIIPKLIFKRIKLEIFWYNNKNNMKTKSEGSVLEKNLRLDFKIISNLIKPGSDILDIGCGSGELLEFLAKEKQVKGRGLELKQDAVSVALARGISVLQGDAEKDLAFYPDNSFEYAILSQTLQATKRPDDKVTHS